MKRYRDLAKRIDEAEAKNDAGLKSKITEAIKKDLGVAVIEPKNSYSEDKEAMAVRYSFIIPMDPSNIYCDLQFSDNELEVYVRFDERDEKQTKSYQANDMVIYPKSIPLTSDLVEILDKLQRSSETTVKDIIIQGIGK